MRWLGVLVAAALLVVPAGPAVAAVRPLPTGTDVDYQLGGARGVPAHVGIVVRDRHAAALRDRYSICYVNGFQTQPDERAFWRKHPRLVLRRNGHPVVDSGWGEQLLDTRTAARRARIAAVVGRWTDGCARSGFAAVEFDNLDSFTRSHGLITRADNKAMARLLVARAHRSGLAAGQKNWAQWDGRRVGYDFAVAEECGRYDECGSYVAHYGDRVVVIEYRSVDFAATCRDWGSRLPVLLADRELSPTGRRSWC
ncbi:MAG: endo alpha-1,4 polygalactosaminidase [Marmoricola sp.]